MTTPRIVPCLLLAIAVSVHAVAQEPGPDAATEAVVRALDDEERRAALAQDFTALERLWHEDFLVNAPSNRITPNRSAVLDLFRNGLAAKESFERNVELVRVDGDIAIVMGAETLTPAGDAPQGGQHVTRRFTNIWKRDGETWRLWIRHANVVQMPAAAP